MRPILRIIANTLGNEGNQIGQTGQNFQELNLIHKKYIPNIDDFYFDQHQKLHITFHLDLKKSKKILRISL